VRGSGTVLRSSMPRSPSDGQRQSRRQSPKTALALQRKSSSARHAELRRSDQKQAEPSSGADLKQRERLRQRDQHRHQRGAASGLVRLRAPRAQNLLQLVSVIENAGPKCRVVELRSEREIGPRRGAGDASLAAGAQGKRAALRLQQTPLQSASYSGEVAAGLEARESTVVLGDGM
jgi:hypothetical protein